MRIDYAKLSDADTHAAEDDPVGLPGDPLAAIHTLAGSMWLPWVKGRPTTLILFHQGPCTQGCARAVRALSEASRPFLMSFTNVIFTFFERKCEKFARFYHVNRMEGGAGVRSRRCSCWDVGRRGASCCPERGEITLFCDRVNSIRRCFNGTRRERVSCPYIVIITMNLESLSLPSGTSGTRRERDSTRRCCVWLSPSRRPRASHRRPTTHPARGSLSRSCWGRVPLQPPHCNAL